MSYRVFRTPALRLLIGGLLVFAVGCKQKDETPPPAPWVDFVKSPTDAPIQWITGAAEYGATVTITGGLSEVEAIADSITGAFRAEVALDTTIPAGEDSVTTTLSITATDEAGNTSEATVVDIVYVADLRPVIDLVDANGSYVICPANNFFVAADGTGSAPADCGNSDPRVFTRGTVIVLNYQVTDNDSLTEVSYKAYGAGASFADYFYMGSGAYVAGSTVDVPFHFTVGGGWFGDIAIVAKAIDADGNIGYSDVAYMRVGLDLAVNGDARAIGAVVASPALTDAWGIVADPMGGALVANNTGGNEFIYWVNEPDLLGTWADLSNIESPEFLAFDSAGNLYVTMDNIDEIWQIPAGTSAPSAYYTNMPNNPEGIAAMGAIPAHGLIDTTGANAPAAGDCLIVEDAPASATSYRLGIGTGCTATACNADGVNPDSCAATGSAADMVTAFNLNASGATGLWAYAGADCTNGVGAGNGASCIALVSSVGGDADNGRVITLDSAATSWNVVSDIVDGRADGVLFVADEGSGGDVIELPTPTSGAALGAYSFNNFIPNGNERLAGIAAALRYDPADTGKSLGTRLFLYAVNNRGANDAAVMTYDSGLEKFGLLAQSGDMFKHFAADAQANDELNNPFGIVYVPGDANGGDCVLVTNREASGAVRFRGEILAYANLDAAAPIGPEGGAPIVVGFDDPRGLALDMSDADSQNWTLLVSDRGAGAIIRVGRTAATGDCF